ncbi:hypothetical protein [Bartonella sp. A05]|uniref:hypothetical protein n=1 Tax=Bartonella sp. A05 TaxID=2967261 RepID=UPI0022A8F1FA|nr:hypothetical protein [Bartonella sp. A05]MCZ2204418.1 hypothetical protein [Bartonella sp. A05]
MPNGQLLAICNDKSSTCPDLPISNNDRCLYTLNLKKIAGFIADLMKEASVFKDVQTIDECASCIRVGHYIPRGTIRYPIFFGIDTYDGDLDTIINHLLCLDNPAILLLPSIDNVGQAKINALKTKGHALIGLQDLQVTESLIDTTKALQSFQTFHKNQHSRHKSKLIELDDVLSVDASSKVSAKDSAKTIIADWLKTVTSKSSKTKKKRLYSILSPFLLYIINKIFDNIIVKIINKLYIYFENMIFTKLQDYFLENYDVIIERLESYNKMLF